MKRIVQLSIVFFLMGISGAVVCQNDTVIYAGINGRLGGPEKAITRKEVDVKSPSRIRVLTSRRSGNSWQKLYMEEIRILHDKTYQIRIKGTGSSEIIYRKYDEEKDGRYGFSESNSTGLVRTGYSLFKIPVVLHGEVIDYYSNGKIKSRSIYKNNELVSNENWLENGEKYIDSVFYSVDEEPMLSGGNFILHHHIRQALKDSGLDFSSLTGNVLLGFVIMETGEMAGIRVMQGLGSKINGIAVDALKSLGGKWKPARLNGKEVRYFQLFPINFISREISFQSLEFDGSRIHYDMY